MPAPNALLSLLRAESCGLVRKGTAKRKLMITLKATKGNLTRAASRLHVHPDTVRRSIRALGLVNDVVEKWPARRGERSPWAHRDAAARPANRHAPVEPAAAPPPHETPVDPLPPMELAVFAVQMLHLAEHLTDGRIEPDHVRIDVLYKAARRSERGPLGDMTLQAFKARLLEASRAELLTLRSATEAQLHGKHRVAAELVDGEARFHLVCVY
jgi:hypothetical protein